MMFNFNIDWSSISDFNANFDPVAFEQEVAALANIATVAAVNSPAVVNAPANAAPSPTEVQPVVQQVIQAVAPVIAPNVPEPVIAKLEQIIPEQVVSNPQVVASPAGSTIPPAVLNTIASSISSTFKNDAQKDAEIRASLQEVASSPTPTPTAAPTQEPVTQPVATPEPTAVAQPPVDQKAETLKTTDSINAPAPVSTAVGPRADVEPTVSATDNDKLRAETARYLLEQAQQPVTTNTAAVRAGEEASMALPPTVPTTSGAESGTIGAIRTEAGIPPEKGAGIPVFPSVTDYIRSQIGAPTGPTGPAGVGTGPTGPGTQGTGPSGFGGGTTGTGQVYTATDGTTFTDQAAFVEYQKLLDSKRSAGQSAYALLMSEFERYGLGALVEPLKGFITEGLSPAEFTLRLRQTDAYKKRFAANQQRIGKGLRALSEAEYIGLEDQYQNVMRQYGLPDSYYTRGEMGRQDGFEKFIAGDVSAAELEDRIQTAQNRVINAAPQVGQALKQFYPDITNGDILAYALDPEQALSGIKRKVQAAEIGGAALQTGLATGLARAEELQRYGVTAETAKQGFGTIAGGLERGRQLSQIYQQPEYTQTTAETELFALPSAEKARRERQKLIKTEQATFGGGTGVTGGALARERAGGF
jgi:hypothetical protein